MMILAIGFGAAFVVAFGIAMARHAIWGTPSVPAVTSGFCLGHLVEFGAMLATMWLVLTALRVIG